MIREHDKFLAAAAYHGAMCESFSAKAVDELDQLDLFDVVQLRKFGSYRQLASHHAVSAFALSAEAARA